MRPMKSNTDDTNMIMNTAARYMSYTQRKISRSV